jgi:gliding-associated putative ABC transporter substrate-binding component GldG
METKKIKTRTELIVYILIILGIVGVINYLGIVWFSRLDLTEDKSYTVSPATKKIMKHLDDIINIKVYCSKDLKQEPRLQSTLTTIKDMLAEYKAYGGKNLRITWIDPSESDAARQEARSIGIQEIQAQVVEQDKIQVVSGFLGLAVLFADRKELMPLGQNLGNFEYDLTRAILKVSRSSTPRIGILKVDTLPEIPPEIMARMGKQQQQPDKTETKFAQLIAKLRENYDVSIVNISQGSPIDSSLGALVIPGSASITDRGAFEIDQFFMKGGKLIALANAMKIDFNQQFGPMAVNVDSKILDLLQFYGVKVNQDMVLDASCNPVMIPQQIGPFSANVEVPYPFFVKIGRDGFDHSNPAVGPLSDVILPWPNSLTLSVPLAAGGDRGAVGQDGVKATILAHSSKKSWLAPGSGFINLNPEQKWQIPSGDTLKSSTLAAYLTGNFKSFFAGKSVPSVNSAVPANSLNKIALQQNTPDASGAIVASNSNGHLVVIGNADFVSSQNAAPQNLLMVVNLVDWLSQDENLIAIRSRITKDHTLEADLLKKGSAMPNVVRSVNIILMPILVIVIGIVIFLRRREHVAAASIILSQATSETSTEEKLR